MNHKRFRSRSVPCAALLLILAGCVSTTPNLDRDFGAAVRLLYAQQTLNPDASRNTDSVAGIDGKAAKGAYDEYLKSYATPEPQQNVFTIGVGGAH